MRKLFISDIHGQHDAMVALLTHMKYEPGVDHLIVGGDLIDRGPQSPQVMQQLKSLTERYPDTVHVLMGNHEHMAFMFANRQNEMWLEHGGLDVLSDLGKWSEERAKDHLNWLFSLPLLYEDDEYVYVHAGFIPSIPLDKQNPFELLWMPYSTSGYTFSEHFTNQEILDCTNGRKVVTGHLPKKYIYDDGARICCDLGASVFDTGAKLALVDLTNHQYAAYHFDTDSIKERKIARGRNYPNG